MEIIVEGKDEKNVTPDEVTIYIEFKYKSQNYSNLITEATNEINDFVKEILIKNLFEKEDLKTISVQIKEEKKYMDETRTYEFDGYTYEQQSKLVFDYDSKKLSNIMQDIENISKPPKYTINFGLKNESEHKNELIKKAFENAKEKAEIISRAANKNLKECIKADFRPFSDFQRDTYYENNIVYERNINEQISQNIVPQEIRLVEKIYCIWMCE